MNSTNKYSRRKVLKSISFASFGLLSGGISARSFATDNNIVRIGILLPISGEANDILYQMEAGIQAGIDILNANGGILGRKVEAIYKDSEGHPNNLEKTCYDLVKKDKVSGIIGPFIAAGRKFASKHLINLDTPLISATNHEGRFCHPNYFSLGSTPKQDVKPLIDHLDKGKGRKYFIVGSYPSWQNSMFRQARFYIYPTEGKVRGQALTDLGEKKFQPILEWIAETDTEIILFCIPRNNGTLFLKQANDMGLLDRLDFAWIGFNELHHKALSIKERKKITTCSSFIMSDNRIEAQDFVSRVHKIKGNNFPVTYYAHNHANAVLALGESWNKAGEISGQIALKTLPGLSYKSVTNNVETIDIESNHSSLDLVIAKGGEKDLSIIKRIGSIKADPGCKV